MNNLSFNELKKLLKNCKNPSEELIIRRKMKDKYISYIKYKNRKNPSKSTTNNLVDNVLDELDQYNCKSSKKVKGNKDDKIKNNMSRDHMNNNLVNRMRNDILIKSNNKKRINKKDFIPPFQ